MGTLLSPTIYGVSSASKPLVIGEGDDVKSVTSYSDFITAVTNLEEIIGQLVTQSNAALNSQEQTLSNNLPVVLDSGTATASDCADAINQIITILTNLNIAPK